VEVNPMNDFKRVLLDNCKCPDMLGIEMKVLNFDFSSKPLLIGGKALEYYGVRESDNDFDFVITEEDYELLSYRYPDNIKEIWGDFGVCRGSFEIWKCICLFEYEFLSEDAIEEEDFLVISFEKLMFLKVLGISSDKNQRDLHLMRDRMAVINTILHDYY
jgi:hypothetical protein